MLERYSPHENNVSFELGEQFSPAIRHFLEENGFVVFGNVFDELQRSTIVAAVQAVADELGQDHPDLTLGMDEEGKPRAGRIYHLSRHSKVISDLILGDLRIRRIAELCPGLHFLDEDRKSAVLFQEKRPEKGSGFKGLRWHDDRISDVGQTLTVGIYLDESTQANGAMRVVPGSHRFDPSTPLPEDVAIHPDEVAITARPGDVTAHLSGLWHCSPVGWVTGEAGCRRVIYLTFSELSPSNAPKEAPPGYREMVDIS